jgi:hypothetical protein
MYLLRKCNIKEKVPPLYVIYILYSPISTDSKTYPGAIRQLKIQEVYIISFVLLFVIVLLASHLQY